MKQALVIVESGISSSKEAVLTRFAETVGALAQRRGLSIEPLNAGAYLVPLDSGLHALMLLVAQAESQQLSLRTLFFDQDPSFVITKPE